MVEFALPDVGEGLTEAEVVAWHVAVGDAVEVNDLIVEIETAKSVVELPSPAAGVIAELHVDVGVTVCVGTVLVSIHAGADTSADLVPEAPSGTEDHPPVDAAADEPPLVLVGTGPTHAPARRRHLRPRSDTRESATRDAGKGSANRDERPQTQPPARHVAKQLGVDLEEKAGTTRRPNTRRDVEAATSDLSSTITPQTRSRETRVPIKGVRKVTAAAMVHSAFTAPHVTEWLTVDVTSTMDMVGRLRQDRNWAEIRATPLVFVAKALLLAIRRFPDINARWDEAAQEIVLHHFVNLGIAVATPRGLIVPNIKDADRLALTGLANAIGSLVKTARSGRTSPADMSNGTITITNIGALGVDAGTPILNPGESAILALGAVREMPWVADGKIVSRKVAQLAMSFDHRLIDGALGSQVLAEVGRILSDPGETILYV